jgi:hypothetical protein
LANLPKRRSLPQPSGHLDSHSRTSSKVNSQLLVVGYSEEVCSGRTPISSKTHNSLTSNNQGDVRINFDCPFTNKG